MRVSFYRSTAKFWEVLFILDASTAVQARINILIDCGSGDLAYTQMIMQHGTVGGETRPAATTDKVLPRIPSGNAAGRAFFSLQARVLRR
jgi:hypothetical protein